jgi:hypothetical protein
MHSLHFKEIATTNSEWDSETCAGVVSTRRGSVVATGQLLLRYAERHGFGGFSYCERTETCRPRAGTVMEEYGTQA